MFKSIKSLVLATAFIFGQMLFTANIANAQLSGDFVGGFRGKVDLTNTLPADTAIDILNGSFNARTTHLSNLTVDLNALSEVQINTEQSLNDLMGGVNAAVIDAITTNLSTTSESISDFFADDDEDGTPNLMIGMSSLEAKLNRIQQDLQFAISFLGSTLEPPVTDPFSGGVIEPRFSSELSKKQRNKLIKKAKKHLRKARKCINKVTIKLEDEVDDTEVPPENTGGMSGMSDNGNENTGETSSAPFNVDDICNIGLDIKDNGNGTITGQVSGAFNGEISGFKFGADGSLLILIKILNNNTGFTDQTVSAQITSFEKDGKKLLSGLFDNGLIFELERALDVGSISNQIQPANPISDPTIFADGFESGNTSSWTESCSL